MALPGIGRTTAGSILSSAFNAPLPILDGNVKRVLARLTAHPRPPARDDALFWCWSEALLDPVRPRDTNQALMDLGATLCTPRQTDDCQVIAAPGNPSALRKALPTLPAISALPLARDHDSPQAPALPGDRCGGCAGWRN